MSALAAGSVLGWPKLSLLILAARCSFSHAGGQVVILTLHTGWAKPWVTNIHELLPIPCKLFTSSSACPTLEADTRKRGSTNRMLF